MEGEGVDHFSGQVILAPTGDGAAFHQGQNAVADHLGVDARSCLCVSCMSTVSSAMARERPLLNSTKRAD